MGTAVRRYGVSMELRIEYIAGAAGWWVVYVAGRYDTATCE
jgi:hypothetical protein